MALRDYQVKLVRDTGGSLRDGNRRVCICLPTGGGKTEVAAHMIQACTAANKKVLWLVERVELVNMAAARLPGPLGVLCAGSQYPPNPFAKLQVAGVDTLVARGQRPYADYVFCDEAHHFASDTCVALLDKYPLAKIIGLTATPERSDGRGLDSVFDDLVCGPSYAELIADGHLVPSEILRPPQLLDSAHLAQHPVDAYLEHAKGTKCIVFARSIELATQYAADFNARGVAARCISAESPWSERTVALADFRAGRIKVLTNVYALCEGVDIPDIETVILARGFSSMGPYLQAVGRGMRPSPGKTRLLIIDLRGCTYELGKPEDDHLYSLDGKGIRLKDPHVYCKVCGTPREPGEGCSSCGWQPNNEPLKGDTITRDRLVAYMKTEVDDKRIDRLRGWIEMAKEKGYKDGWALGRFKGCYSVWPTKEQMRAAQ